MLGLDAPVPAGLREVLEDLVVGRDPRRCRRHECRRGQADIGALEHVGQAARTRGRAQHEHQNGEPANDRGHDPSVHGSPR